MFNEVQPQVKDCKVVLEDIFRCSVAVKPKTLKPCPDKPHMTPFRHTAEIDYLKGLELRPPIKWCKMDDERWSELDSAVFSKLHNSKSIFERLQLLEETIFSEASKLFGLRQSMPKKLSGKSRRTLNCIKLIQEKNRLLLKISSSGNSLEISALKDLLNPIREKIKCH